MLKISVIMPVERLGGDAEGAIASVLAQAPPFAFELIVVSAERFSLPADNRYETWLRKDRIPNSKKSSSSLRREKFSPSLMMTRSPIRSGSRRPRSTSMSIRRCLH